MTLSTGATIVRYLRAAGEHTAGSIMIWPRSIVASWFFWMAVLAAGCTGSDLSLEDWSGHHRDKLVRTWGEPAEDTLLSDGATQLVYRHDWGDGYGRYTCRRIFVTDDQGIIRSWSALGC